MVAARSVTVKLKLDASDFNRGLAQAAASAKAFERQLSDGGGNTIFSSTAGDVDHLSSSVGDLDTSTKSLNKTLGDTDRNSRTFGKGIAASNSHLALMVQYGVALGPSLVPALAAAVPLAAALGSGLAVASVGAGTAVLAFQGVGDALKAMNDYAIDPTDEHLKKLNETMDTLGPAGQNFVVFLQELRPEIQQLQDLAQEGMFPGIQEGIESLMTQMPLIQGVIQNVSTAMGELAADAGHALTSPFWTEFFTYIQNDATEIITNFSVGFGKLFEGISALLLDFAPLTRTISSGFADMGRAFSSWAQGLPQTEGFQEFIRYLRETGPQVLSTIANLGEALLDIGVALSGLPAEASLAVLNTLADVLSAIATSPIGPGLLTAAVGIATLNRAIGLWDTVQASAVMQFFGGKGLGAGLRGGGLAGALSGAKGLATASNITKVSGAVGLLALSMTGLGDAAKDAGISGTLTGASIGAFFGPWGAAAGAAAGAITDAASANNDFETSIDNVNSALEATPTKLSAINAALATSRNEMDEQLDRLEGGGSFGAGLAQGFDPAWHKNHVEGIFGKSDADEIRDNFQEAEDAAARFSVTVAALKNQFDDNFLTREFSGKELQDFLDDVQPALDHFGITMADLNQLSIAKGKGGVAGALAQQQWEMWTKKLEHYSETAQTTEGKSKAVGEALAALGADAGNTQADIDALSQALDNLFSPALDYSRAMDEWRQGLADLEKDLKGSSLDPNSDVGRANREVIRQRVEDMLNVLNTAAATGEIGGRQLINRLQTMREQMIKVGKEAGLQGPKLRDFLATLNLTPKQIRIAVHAAGVEKARLDAKNLADDIKKIPKDVKTDIAANGVDADATVKSLMGKYEGLTKYQAKTILRAQDAASGTIKNVLGHLKGVDKDFVARISVDTGSSLGAIAGVAFGLNQIDGRVATATVVTNYQTGSRTTRKPPSADGNLFEFADGGFPTIGSQQPKISRNMGPNGIMWAETGAGPWEAFISGHPGKRERSKDIATDVVNRLGGITMFADGGRIGRNISAADIGRRSVNDNLSFMRDLERALKRMRHEAQDVVKAENQLHRARERSRNATHRLNQISRKLEQAQDKEHVDKQEVYRLKQLEIAQRKREREAIKAQTREEKQLAKQEAELAKARDKWKEQQQQLLSQAQAISSVIREQGAIFGGQGTSVSVGGILAKLRSANQDAQKFRHYIAKLRGIGLDERIIQQLLEQGPTPEGLATARNLAQASEHELRQINRQERQLVGVAASTGALGVARQSAGVIVNMNIKKVETTDVRALARELPRQTVRALRVARAKA